MSFTRRDLLKVAGGSAAGILLTPVPWKLLDDVAIWTQNGPWIPRPPRGDVSTRFSTCTLCPAGCGLRVKLVGNHPVSVSPVPNHPRRSSLCPAGLLAHHMVYHPLRMKAPARIASRDDRVDAEAVSLQEVLTAITSAISASDQEGQVAVLDQRPGRAQSTLLKRFVSAQKNGVYLTPPSDENVTAHALNAIMTSPIGSLGFDIEHARSIVSFGAPVLEDSSILQQQMAMKGGERIRVTQVESGRSRSAVLADRWIPIKPGTEAAFAMGLAHVLIADKMYDRSFVERLSTDFSTYRQLASRFTPERAAEITGTSADAVVGTARELGKRTPSIVVAGSADGGSPHQADEARAIWGLNFLLGNIGRTGGIVRRREESFEEAGRTFVLPASRDLASTPDHSIRLLLIDSSAGEATIPWSLVEKKLIPEKSLVVSFSPILSGIAAKSNFIIPTPTHLESTADVATPFGATLPSYALSSPLYQPPTGVVKCEDVLNALTPSTGTVEEEMKRRVGAIHKTGRGKVFKFKDGSFVETRTISSPDELQQSLLDGALWLDSPRPTGARPRFSFLEEGVNGFNRMLTACEKSGNGQGGSYLQALVLMGMPAGLSSPLMTKVYQESNLRQTAQVVLVHPETAGSGMDEGSTVVVETAKGSLRMTAHLDRSVKPGVLQVTTGPDPVGFIPQGFQQKEGVLSLVEVAEDGTWKSTHAVLRKV
ncbi:MAG: molybdopterin-dependent oxidoreductase [Bacteroidota bacterium]